MKRSTLWAAFVLGMAFAVRGETYRMSGGDAINTSSFNTIGKWVLDSNTSVAATEPPSPGNDYIVRGSYLLRTPNASTADFTFGGDSLTFANVSSYLAFKGKSGATITVNNLIADGGYVQNATDWTYFNLAGNITVKDGKDFRLMTVEPSERGIVVKAPISGNGTEIWLQLPRTNLANNANKYVRLEGDNSGFTGKFRATGGGNFTVNSDVAFGAVPTTVTADAITINGPLWIITNNLETAATRGITLPNTQNATTANTANNCYPGMKLQVSSYATAWIRGPISGAGPIVKTGDSGNVHFTGSFANYTGEITLGRGVTWFDGPDAVSLPRVRLEAGMGVSSNGLTITTFDLVKGNLCVDLRDANPDVPLLTVTESLTFTREGAINVYSTSATVPERVYGTTFQLVKAPRHALSEALAHGWIYPNNADVIDLAVRDNGDGTETLLFTRQASSNVYYHAVADVIDTSAFTTLSWKHNRGDASEEAVAAAAGNTYVVNWGVFRTPDRGSVYTFPGSKLAFSGIGVTLKGYNGSPICYMTNTWCMNKSDWWVSTPHNVRIGGDLHLMPVGDYALSFNSASQKRSLDVYSELSGAGQLQIYGYGNPAYGSKMYTVALHAANTNFHGIVYARGQTNFYCRIASEESLGANPSAFVNNQLRFNGAGLMVTNNVTLDDSNRGIWLYDTGGTCGMMQDDADVGASYATNTLAADRVFPGGAWFNAYGTGTTLRVDCPIAGPGALSVYADGMVILGGANAYTGGTVVRRGTLVPASAGALPGAVTVMAGGTLCAPDDQALPYGAVLNGAITFEEGSALTHAGIASRIANNEAFFTVPLLLLAPGQTMTDAKVASLPVAAGLPRGWIAKPKQATVTVDGVARTAISAEIKFGGTTIIIR
jgi:autotransporter-associated beta strand protein